MANYSRPFILISNDDGIHAPGILALLEVAQEFGDVVVVAPDSPQSGMGQAITFDKPLRVYKSQLHDGRAGYACNGTPADSVKMGLGVLLSRMPDLVLSGINHGLNTSISAVYSGTISAAREGAIHGFPAIAFSLDNNSHEADFSAAKAIVRVIIQQVLEQQLPKGQLLNVNIPNLPLEQIKGIRSVRQGKGHWVEDFQKHTDKHGHEYYWLSGRFISLDSGEDTDIHAIDNGYVSVTPLQHDLTHYPLLESLQSQWDFAL